jgi:hypothetical protein
MDDTGPTTDQPNEPTEQTCQHCGLPIPARRAKRETVRYCSRKCGKAAYRGRKIGRITNPSINPTTGPATCQHCGLLLPPERAKWSHTRYCSRACWRGAYQTRRTGHKTYKSQLPRDLLHPLDISNLTMVNPAAYIVPGADPIEAMGRCVKDLYSLAASAAAFRKRCVELKGNATYLECSHSHLGLVYRRAFSRPNQSPRIAD